MLISFTGHVALVLSPCKVRCELEINSSMVVIYFDAEQCRPRHGHLDSKIREGESRRRACNTEYQKHQLQLSLARTHENRPLQANATLHIKI
jgi:hypothetical protein